ncbi:MAG: hypothetical protein ACXAEN_27400 [Candidatus Thorarchaeota archaeon]
MSRNKRLERVRKDVHLRLEGDKDLRMFLDRGNSPLTRAQALRGIMLEFMGEVSREGWTALDTHKAKKVYRMWDKLSSGILRASETLRDHIIETVGISNE